MKKNVAALILTLCIAINTPLTGCASIARKPPKRPETSKTPKELLSPDFEISAGSFIGKLNDAGLSCCDADFIRIPYDYNARLREPYYYIAEAPDNFTAAIAERLAAASSGELKPDKYNGEYFKKYFVLVFCVSYGSGSARTKLAGAEVKDGKIIIRLESVMPEIGTCDMASFAGLISLSKSCFSPETPIELYLDGCLVQPSRDGKKV